MAQFFLLGRGSFAPSALSIFTIICMYRQKSFPIEILTSDSISGLCRASPLAESVKRITSTYLPIGDGLAVLVLIDNSRLLVNRLGELRLGHALRGAGLLDGLAKAKTDLLVCEAQRGGNCERRGECLVSVIFVI